MSEKSGKYSESFNLSPRFNQNSLISLLCIVKCSPQFVSPHGGLTDWANKQRAGTFDCNCDVSTVKLYLWEES